jgi:hypothetical protein
MDFATGTTEESIMQEGELEVLRRGIPAARGLPLLAALAGSKSAEISIAYFDNNHLRICVTPC